MDDLINLRQTIHRYPELSHQEFDTSKRISEFIAPLSPDRVISLGRTGKAFVFEAKNPGPTVVFRADLDALPINEISELPYRSENKGVAHLCGHDGHMTMLCGLAQKIASDRPAKGRAVLLFQHAEEVGEGAHEIVESDEFRELKPDYVFGLHNIPSVPKNHIIIKSGSFAAASKGMTVKLIGKTAHAGQPEKGINPAMAVSKIIQETHALIADKKRFQDLVLLTIIHVKLGKIAFGTSPGYAEVRITLRAYENRDMENLEQQTEKIIRDLATQEKLNCNITYTEIFPATVNDEACTTMIKEAATANKLTIHPRKQPFRWSEDFGYYSQRYKSGFFGLGSGKNQPQLHNPDYNFPDEIMESGIKMFYTLYQNLLRKS